MVRFGTVGYGSIAAVVPSPDVTAAASAVVNPTVNDVPAQDRVPVARFREHRDADPIDTD